MSSGSALCRGSKPKSAEGEFDRVGGQNALGAAERAAVAYSPPPIARGRLSAISGDFRFVSVISGYLPGIFSAVLSVCFPAAFQLWFLVEGVGIFFYRV
jgi:hypothetical protein